MSIFYRMGVENKEASALLCDGMEMRLKVVTIIKTTRDIYFS